MSKANPKKPRNRRLPRRKGTFKPRSLKEAVGLSELRKRLPELRNYLHKVHRIPEILAVDRTVSQMSIEEWGGADDGR